LPLLLLFGPFSFINAYPQNGDPIVLGNSLFRYVIGADGKNQAFADRASGKDYLRTNEPGPCAVVWKGEKSHPAIALAKTNDNLRVRFKDIDTELTLKMEILPKHVVLTVKSVAGSAPDKIWFLNVPLELQGRPDETFGACALALNLNTRVDALPALQRDLRAVSENWLGFVGAKVALVAAPREEILKALQEALSTSNEMPVCRAAGPWAGESAMSRGSYLFNFGSLSTTNLDEWVSTVHSLGFTQIDNHGGGSFFRFGDLVLDAQRWPEGWATWEKEIIPRLRSAGINSIFHTYCFFIDKRSKYVTPVPDRRLDAFRTFTLTKPISADAVEIAVNESTADVSLITGFFEHNSVTLHVDDELIVFGGVSKQAPWTFTKVTRGAHGTKAASHEAGAKARQLKELFGLFVPDAESTLFTEIAANHADIVNRCGFDGLYLDAIDGASILRGGDQAWYWASKFLVEIQQRLRKPVGMEMSAMWHHFWQYRTRWQAWDFPVRGHVRFQDLHAESIHGGLLLPLHLGWWTFNAFNPPQVEPTYPNVMDTLGARLVGWDAGASMTEAVGPDALARTPMHRRSVEILQTCERLRHSGVYSEPAKAQLRDPGAEFLLFTNAAGKPRFRKLQSVSHVASPSEEYSLSWLVTNAFAPQPARFRIEALMSASTITTSTVVLADFASTGLQGWKQTSASGVSLNMVTNGAEVTFSVTNSGQVPRKGAWTKLEKQFDPPLDLGNRQALSLVVEGDGSGALMAVRLESPSHISFGAIADRYVVLDFVGRRALTLVETESSRWSDYTWNDNKSLYNVYRETVNFGVVDRVSVWIQNAPENATTKVKLSAIRAVPLQPVPLRNPVLTFGDQKIALQAEVPTGGWIECNGTADCVVYGPKGVELGKATVSGEWPQIPQGGLPLTFGAATEEKALRARVVVFNVGDEI
jgi:hypothetical protein